MAASSMGEEILYQRAQISDGQAIHGLLQRQFGEHDIDLPGPSLAEAVDRMLEDEALGFFVVARREGAIVGVAAVALAWTLEHGGLSAWLDELYVVPEYREGGVGRALLEAAIAEARRRGCAAMDLEVEEEHRRAEHLYERAGFRALPRSRWVKGLGEG
jgi:GNAT superfamily N-acetyltransferase